MSDANDGKTAPQGNLSFLKGSEEFLPTAGKLNTSWVDLTSKTRGQLSEALSAKNIAFLLGSGASSLEKDGSQWGIPTMGPLAKEFSGGVGKRGDKLFLTATEKKDLRTRFGIDLSLAPYSTNLEKLLEVLFSLRLALTNSVRVPDKQGLALVRTCIGKTQAFIFSKCTDGLFANWFGDKKVLEIYKAFYRTLVFRDRSLPRPWVFTTNYDLFNETALDQLGVPYCNGFSGTIERRFNPSMYRYALAEQIDISQRRWSAVDGFIYLCKLHGSVSWVEDEHGLYPIRELQVPSPDGKVMIYPTPTKQSSSFGAPYSDLFREFQSRIAREQSVLFALGYSFGDEHVNNIIYQALTIPTFRLVIFGSATNPALTKLRDLNDPRIWIISGESPEGLKAHHFELVVNQLLPSQPTDHIDVAVAKVIESLLRPKDGSENASP
ncbi:SIR2 family protein [Stenotrophobium rhamnosiphilum]|uniref:SIR2 family protein n=1 Tax=Stenotrophobium rhamnosiphilum TaxID=2029166 RepID=A0A2T5MB09_9GAMM|nr:SIR2 family protein [Stenotrophobium rhamnosiphilum]PTU27730.1 SIR2 family protein [Stenotrophobium rhamnosiphilum]